MTDFDSNPYRSPGDAPSTPPETSLAKRLVAAWLLASLASFVFFVVFSLFKIAFYGLTASVTVAYAASWLPYYGLPFFSALAAALVARWTGMFFVRPGQAGGPALRRRQVARRRN
ncbi:hypothetical protein [Lignipirellula cremea]|uniref:Uncharacterized protein n=1 Tax=Lignipirellula cremea TaxID=2528010 RepID=A0A518DRJ6_9BACT|nr:hypothetical protein [Lignipirellula cremea]QDU94461.1 hypothetical protein Pla8534_22520 [Lignipirellula cremea]